ncbi:MAG: hypothetical protein NVS4B6_19960 [Mycobacterium sp.]
MSTTMIILVLLIATALAFDFTNGFHDTGNAMATSIATGALKPKVAVLLAGVLNLVGAFLSVEVAVTVTTSVLKVQDSKTGIRTLGKGLVEIESPQGLAAEAAPAAVILSSSAAGMAPSTTHVATGSILGSGVGRPGAEVRWAVAGRMVAAWLITLPAAGLVGALSYWLSEGVDSVSGSALARDGVIFLILVTLSGYMYWRAQQQKVDSNNVNADWDESTNSVVPADVREASNEARDKAAV